MRLIVGLVALVVVMIGSPRAADACSCALPQPAISPADGSTSVPLNARVLVSFDTDSVEVELRVAASQVEIPLTFDVHQRMRAFGSWQIADAVSLQANTQYELNITGNFPSVRTTFTTGDSTDVMPSAFAGIESISLETMTYPISGCINSCVEAGSGHVSRIRVGHTDPSPDAALLVFELLRESDRAVIDQVPMSPRPYGDVRVLGSESCGRQSPVLDAGERYCGRLTAYDVAGNVSGSTVEICDEAATCKPIETAGCAPADSCDPQTNPKTPNTSNGCSTSCGTTSGLAVILVFAASRRRRNVAQDQTAR